MAAEGGERSVGPPFRAGNLRRQRGKPAERATEQRFWRSSTLSPASRARLFARRFTRPEGRAYRSFAAFGGWG